MCNSNGPGHTHSHANGHAHAHASRAEAPTRVSVEKDVLGKNDRLADYNRGWLAGRGVLALNLVSSPGAGKTALLERTLRDLAGTVPMSVIEGDQETDLDAQRIRAAGGRAVQLNTGAGCHLDAAMVARGLAELDPPVRSVVFIENVGNLVCPALFDLGERAKVVVCSVTEGDDKPLKYPHMFRAGALVLLNKTDLPPYVPFDPARFRDGVRQLNPAARVIAVSALRGEGLAEWYDWVREQTGARAPVVA
ncbi:hydrogenase nickel incorporation protein HypB [Frigoriglobus tundricola]|uniref:[NiFe] hydrogenase nickel incorporation-associated protein HypB n=1 Tax=Frigoriglobus tundricola TaxID=2774151 RepID=A0A6M5YLW6_9BACT|nr:hydrogenase nickel incorporation protein HypB [Frigoriglobus tundricola]QJW94948.1 [NiFe] hydrogenase nickel incorporation-associated protein HypB [Frigoriglobus tundricola]